MRSTPIFLRLLLCVLLAFNGTSAAGRSLAGHVQHAAAALPDDGMATSHRAMPPCHVDGRAPMTMDRMTSAAAGERLAPLEASKQCCDSSACQCACMHQCAATMVASLHVASLPPARRVERGLGINHQAPALLRLIRPPIS